MRSLRRAARLQVSARRFAFEITTITVGILIALSVDGIVEWNRERALVREARASITREIADNLKGLEGTFPAFEKHERDLEQALQFANELLQTGKTDVNQLNFALSMPSLNRASWQTAERTGALSYMEYADVKEYNELYELQDVVVESQRALVARLSGLLAFIGGSEGGDPSKSRAQDLEAFRTRVLDAIGAAYIHKSLARSLADEYKKAEARQSP
jgi:hypothetical protein